jgi:hypothetical protein
LLRLFLDTIAHHGGEGLPSRTRSPWTFSSLKAAKRVSLGSAISKTLTAQMMVPEGRESVTRKFWVVAQFPSCPPVQVKGPTTFHAKHSSSSETDRGNPGCSLLRLSAKAKEVHCCRDSCVSSLLRVFTLAVLSLLRTSQLIQKRRKSNILLQPAPAVLAAHLPRRLAGPGPPNQKRARIFSAVPGPPNGARAARTLSPEHPRPCPQAETLAAQCSPSECERDLECAAETICSQHRLLPDPAQRHQRHLTICARHRSRKPHSRHRCSRAASNHDSTIRACSLPTLVIQSFLRP